MSLQPIPAAQLYPPLKALDFERASRSRVFSPQADQEASSKRTFVSLLEAAHRAQSPKQFSEILGNGASGSTKPAANAGSHGAITKLLVSYKGDQVLIEVEYSDGYSILAGYTWS